MSVIVFAGAAQFAAVGYVAGGLPWIGVILLTGLLNARHLLYSASLGPWLQEVPRSRRAVMAHVLTDEAFALTIAHFRRLRQTDERGYWIAAIVATFIPWNLATIAGVYVGGSIPDPNRFGVDIIFPAAMVGLAVGLITGRRELVAAIVGAGIAVGVALVASPAIGIVAGGVLGPAVGPARSCRDREGDRAAGHTGQRRAIRHAGHASRGRRPGGLGPMSTNLVLLAVLMFAVTYPTRALGLLAPAFDRLPQRAFDYLQLVGPAVLAALAAVSVMVISDDDGGSQFYVGIEWIAVLACLAITAWRRNLLLGLIASVAVVVIARATGLSALP